MLNRISDYLPVAWSMAQKPRTPQAPASTLTPEQISSWTKSVESFVRTHPGTSLAAAFCVGVAVAWWIKRK